MTPLNFRSKVHYHERHRLQTNKLLDRITYSPTKHKQKKVKNMRQKLQEKALPSALKTLLPTKIKFGSFNVNGLSLETCWAVQELLRTREFDVTFYLSLKSKIININIYRYLL